MQVGTYVAVRSFRFGKLCGGLDDGSYKDIHAGAYLQAPLDGWLSGAVF